MGYKHCLESFFGGLLGVEAERFGENLRRGRNAGQRQVQGERTM